MFASRLARMNEQIARVMLDGVCTIERPDSGSWVSLGEFPCNVQSSMSAVSVEDRSIARSDEQKQTVLFLMPDAPVATGYRVLWGGRIWNMGAETSERTAKGLVRVILTDWQIAVAAEALTFWRMRDSQRVTVGTFNVSVTLDAYNTEDGIRTEMEGNTASGATDTGTMVGGADLEAVQIGDWFTRDGAPGRITAKHHSDSERLRLEFATDRPVR